MVIGWRGCIIEASFSKRGAFRWLESFALLLELRGSNVVWAWWVLIRLC